jgi:hypothetical protein
LIAVFTVARTLWHLDVPFQAAIDARKALATVGLVAKSKRRDRRVSDAELEAITTLSWTAAASMTTARGGATQILLANGHVLVAGGAGSTGQLLTSAEIYDPVANTWTAVANPNANFAGWAKTLANGKILFWTDTTAGIYDPVANTWTVAPVPPYLGVSGDTNMIMLLPSGDVLVSGIYNEYGDNTSIAELYDPVANAWTTTPSTGYDEGYDVAALLPSGKVMVAGSYFSNAISNGSEIYDPVANTWTVAANLNYARANPSGTVLQSSAFLVCGGYTLIPTGTLSSCELYW